MTFGRSNHGLLFVTAYLSNIAGDHVATTRSHRGSIETISADLSRFKEGRDVVVVNLAFTEKLVDDESLSLAHWQSSNRRWTKILHCISPAMLYAIRRIVAEGMPYGNFTPSVAADVPALIEFAERQRCSRSPAKTARPARHLSSPSLPRR